MVASGQVIHPIDNADPALPLEQLVASESSSKKKTSIKMVSHSSSQAEKMEGSNAQMASQQLEQIVSCDLEIIFV